jgi:hypothetical protein
MAFFNLVKHWFAHQTKSQQTRSQTFIARRRPIEMKARKVTREYVVDTWEGPRTAYIGDYIMIGVKGESWPVAGDKFRQLYDIVGDTSGETDGEGNTVLRVRKRIMDLPVFQTYQPLHFQTNGEAFSANQGDFIVCQPDGSHYPCDPNVFFETFEIIRPATQDEDFSLDAA